MAAVVAAPWMALVNEVLVVRLVVDMMAIQQLVEMVLDKRYTIYLKGEGRIKKKIHRFKIKKEKRQSG